MNNNDEAATNRFVRISNGDAQTLTHTYQSTAQPVCWCVLRQKSLLSAMLAFNVILMICLLFLVQTARVKEGEQQPTTTKLWIILRARAKYHSIVMHWTVDNINSQQLKVRNVVGLFLFALVDSFCFVLLSCISASSLFSRLYRSMCFTS